MMQLRVTSRYSNQTHAYEPGQIIDVDEAMARWLMADAPGCFVPVDAANDTADADGTEDGDDDTKAVDEPPQDKMVKRSPRRKRSK